MNRIDKLFQQKQREILSIYFTAGHPSLDSAKTVIKALSAAGADMIEIGIPFSDPMADGPVIQSSSSVALKNGMSVKLLFSQLKDIRKETNIPLLFMGYLNPVLQYGIEKFCADCAGIGIDGVILPDLPLDVYGKEYRAIFEKNGIYNICLITPQTTVERIRKIDDAGSGFIYMVSSSSTTGIRNSFGEKQIAYFRRIQEMKLKNPTLVGFGISTKESYYMASQYASGVIVGSAFVKMLSESKDLESDIPLFIGRLKGVK